MICGSICWELVDEQAYGNILCAFVMRVNTLTLYTWAEILSDLCESVVNVFSVPIWLYEMDCTLVSTHFTRAWLNCAC